MLIPSRPCRVMQGEGEGMMKECTKVSFQEATCIIDGELMDCLYIIEESNGYKDESVVTNCCKMPENEDEASSILFNEYLDSNYEILETVTLK